MHDQIFKNNKYCTVLGEASLYDRFNIQATVSHVSGIDNHERDENKKQHLFMTKKGFEQITVFSQLTKEIENLR